MTWYIQYEIGNVKESEPEKKLLFLECPNDYKDRKWAIESAKKVLEKTKLKNPKLVWIEDIAKSKPKNTRKEKFLGL
jgi:hypothetical protein